MPAATGKTGIGSKIQGLQKSFNNHKGDETKYGGGGEVPEGIEGGVAQLIEAKIDEYKEGDNKGKLYLQLRGVVISPKKHMAPVRDPRDGKVLSHSEVSTEGMHVMKMVPLHDTKSKTQDEQVQVGLNETRKMGIETKDLSVDDWEATLAALKEAQPYFKFRTYRFGKKKKGAKGYNEQYDGPDAPLPRVNIDFKGVCDFSSNGEATSHVEDNSGDSPTDETSTEDQQSEASGDEAVDWLELASQADTDPDVQAQFKAAGDRLGVDVVGADTWEAAAEALIAAEGGAASETNDEPSAEPWKPSKDDVYILKMKEDKKESTYIVTSVGKGTVDVKNVANKKLYKGIKWSSDPDKLNGADVKTP